MAIQQLNVNGDQAREALRRLLPFLALGAAVTKTPIDDQVVAWLRANIESDEAWSSFAGLVGLK